MLAALIALLKRSLSLNKVDTAKKYTRNLLHATEHGDRPNGKMMVMVMTVSTQSSILWLSSPPSPVESRDTVPVSKSMNASTTGEIDG